jgi:CopG family nickel-responsive transcriptional regulator
MERFTISLDEELAREFDELVAQRGYQNRSEAIRDLLRHHLESSRQPDAAGVFCVANLSYIYNHHERDLAERLAGLQHSHHDLIVATQHVHLDHDNCLESVILKGPVAVARAFADSLIAERGVRHGQLNIVAVARDKERHTHDDGHGGKTAAHFHLHPRT